MRASRRPGREKSDDQTRPQGDAAALDATVQAVRDLGFSCAPTTEARALRAPLRRIVPNAQVRRLLASWAVFPSSGGNQRARLVRAPVAGVVGDRREERKVAGKVASPGDVVRVPFRGEFVRVS